MSRETGEDAPGAGRSALGTDGAGYTPGTAFASTRIFRDGITMRIRLFDTVRLAGAVALAASLPAFAGNWALYGPANGELTAITGHPLADGVLAAWTRTEDGRGPVIQPWFTLDNGARWRVAVPVNTAASTRALGTIGVGGTPNVVYLEAGDRILRSDDEATTWVPLDFGPYTGAAPRLAGVNPINGAEVVAVSGATLLRSTDSGSTWIPVPGAPPVAYATVDWFARIAYVVLAGTTSTRTLRLSDGVTIGSAGFAPTSIVADRNLAFATGGGNLYRSSNNGLVWQLTLIDAGQVNFGGVALAPGGAGTVYAWEKGGAGRLWRSNDQGQNWLPRGTVPCTCEWTGIAVAVSDANVFVATTTAGAYRSLDGGLTLTAADASTLLTGRDASRLVSDAGDKVRKWFVTDQGPLTTATNGTAWAPMAASPSGDVLNPLFVHPEFPGMLFGQDAERPGGRRLWRSLDSGENWKIALAVENGGDVLVVSLVVSANGNEMFAFLHDSAAVGTATRVYRSIDAGQSWAPRAAPPLLDPHAAVRTSVGLLVAGTPTGAGGSPLWRSTDGGQTWSPVSFTHDVAALEVSTSDRSRVYLGTRLGGTFGFYTSADGGLTWTASGRALGSAAVESIAVHPTKPAEVVVAQFGDGVFRSIDAGANWTPLDAGLIPYGQAAVAYDLSEPRYLYASGAFGVHRTDLTSGAPTGSARAYEFYYAAFDHYFVTAEPAEVDVLDRGVIPGWTRTGHYALVETPDGLQKKAVCRFFGTGFAPKSSHFYTPYVNECDLLKADPIWVFEGVAFAWRLPDANGRCDLGRRPLYRVYNNAAGAAPNHRYTTSLSIVDAMQASGWVYEGDGRTLVFACVPN